MMAYVSATAAVFRRDLRLALSYRMNFVALVLGGFFSLTLFYYVSQLVRVRAFATPEDYYAFVVVGLVILQMLNSTLQSAPSLLRQDVVVGTFERNVLSPFGPAGTMVASLVYPFVNALVVGVFMLGFGSLVFGLPVQWSTAALAIPLGVMGALAFAPFGIMLMAVVLVFKQAATGTTWIVAAIAIISGLYFPVELLPTWIEWAADVQPFTPAADLLRNVLVGTPLANPAWVEVAKVAGFAIVLMPASIAAVHLALGKARQLGTTTEY
jgi:ABC-type multidrug transport system permease subunit